MSPLPRVLVLTDRTRCSGSLTGTVAAAVSAGARAVVLREKDLPAAERARQWPHAMIATATHDTKRGEDVRARLAVLAEIPAEWAAAVDRWEALAPTPDGALGHLLWQCAVGAGPLTGGGVELVSISDPVGLQAGCGRR